MPNVTEIGYEAFNSCYNLASVTMPNVTEIGDYVFYHCNVLTSVSMPNVQTVGNNAFDSCFSLISVSMPNVQTVGSNAFYGCTSLASVSMPSAIEIVNYAFSHISTSTEFESQTTNTIDNWFGNNVFGSEWGPVTITCSNGSVYAVWENDTWNIAITPVQ